MDWLVVLVLIEKDFATDTLGFVEGKFTHTYVFLMFVFFYKKVKPNIFTSQTKSI